MDEDRKDTGDVRKVTGLHPELDEGLATVTKTWKQK